MDSESTRKLPPLLPGTAIDSPLDLSVRRPEAGDQSSSSAPSQEFSKLEDRRYSMPASFLDKNFRHRLPLILHQAGKSMESSSPMTARAGTSVAPIQTNVPSPTTAPTAGPEAGGLADLSSGSACLNSSFESAERASPPTFSPGVESVHPKKRKNLWRPYHSEFDEDKDGDSSDSNSFSDQDTKTEPATETRIDPMKKRKMDMLKYADRLDQLEQTSAAESVTSEMQLSEPLCSEANGNDMDVSTPHFSPTPNTDSPSVLSKINEDITKAQLALFTNFPESREKIAAGMKKRDIFGWGLKLSTPVLEDNKETESVEPTKASGIETGGPSENVWKDGDKTYFELQTVRKSSPNSLTPPPLPKEQRTPSPKRGKTSPSKQGKKSSKVHSYSSPSSPDVSGDSKVVQPDGSSSPLPITVSGGSSAPKVIIMGREQYTEDAEPREEVVSEETKKKTATYQSLSLIDLVEEIEAEAREKERSQNTKPTKNKNHGIAALLQQCNHVKVTALDFLMSNVLLGDKEKPYQTKNARVQQMLKGDKIQSVSMLDVLELQVEVGLS